MLQERFSVLRVSVSAFKHNIDDVCSRQVQPHLTSAWRSLCQSRGRTWLCLWVQARWIKICKWSKIIFGYLWGWSTKTCCLSQEKGQWTTEKPSSPGSWLHVDATWQKLSTQPPSGIKHPPHDTSTPPWHWSASRTMPAHYKNKKCFPVRHHSGLDMSLTHLVGTGTSVKAPSITACCRRTNATNGASRKSTSPTSTLEASASLGNFFMNLFLSFDKSWEEGET